MFAAGRFPAHAPAVTSLVIPLAVALSIISCEISKVPIRKL